MRVRDKLINISLFGVAAALLLGIANMPVQHAKGQSTALGPNLYAYTAVTTAQVIIGANATRHALQICNPGGTNILWIAPQGTPITGQTGALSAIITPSANGGGTIGVPVTASGVVPCFAPPANAPSIGQAWAGFSTTTPVTVLEWP